MSKIFEELKQRGYFYQFTDEEKVKELLDGEPITAYVGIDPTADSLHIGHCFPLIVARRLQEAGHKVIVLLGGATAMIGDPSGKTDMRKMVDDSFVDNNKQSIYKIVGTFVKLDGDNPAIIVNNADWYKNYNYINFMRDIGVHFNVNKMLACDAYKNRLDNGGLTFFEMGYMLMQAYDFVQLNKKYNCVLEFGGSDQWANILAGAELGRKLAFIDGNEKPTFEAFTHTLLLNSEGNKMGKTEKGALWVNKDKCSAYEFFQYFYNCSDVDTERMLKLLTFLSLNEIEKIMKKDIREAKKIMAFEITKNVHGEEEAIKAVEIAKSFFEGEGNLEDCPTYELDNNYFISAKNIVDLAVESGLVQSKNETRRLITQGAISLNNQKVNDINFKLSKDDFKDNYAILRRGKKNYIKICIK